MQRLATDLFFSPSDLHHFVECEHLTALDLLAVDGRGVAKEDDPQADIMRAAGLAHEQAWLQRLLADGRQVVTMAAAEGFDWDCEAARTEAAMRDGAEVIYQGVFIEAPWRGIADFLVRVDTPSRLGGWSYEASDTKLARHPKPSFILQLCWYTEQLARLQGTAPRQMHVVLGSGETVSYAPAEFFAYYRTVRARFLRALGEGRETYPSPVGHCHVCGYASHCAQRREADDHLSLVAGLRTSQAERLRGVGITTVAQLGALDPATPTGIMPQALDRLVRQARLQVEARSDGHRYELLAPDAKRGFGLLPAPSSGDVFFDIEGYPFFAPAHGLEYLWGVLVADAASGWRFQSFECIDRAGERRAFEAFIDFVHTRLETYPDLHVYHYAAYETSAVTRLMGEHATREADVDDLLRRGVFVDLYRVVRQSMQISYDSYSLKHVREFFMAGAGEGAVTDGGASILEFQRFLDTGDEAILAAIRDYNREDCESTRQLRDWLLERKGEAERQFGVEIPWWTTPARAEQTPEDRDQNSDLRDRLTRAADDVLADASTRAAAARLTHLVDYHRREAKPEWWAFFDRLKKSLDELREDTQAIAYLTPVAGVPPRQAARSLIHTLEFPEQEFKLRDGARVCEPMEGNVAGEIGSIDLAGWLELKRGPGMANVAVPAALMADGPVPTQAQRAALVRVADALLANEPRHRVARELLARRAPRVRGRPPGSRIQTISLVEQQALVAALDDSHLFIQGPPGSGKTYTGARLIVSLVEQGKRVAVTATSHKAIHNLLDEVVAAAAEAHVVVTGLKKSSGSDESAYLGQGFATTADNAVCAATDAPIVAGTSWLFARQEMEGCFDYLFIDEAGQVSLADAVAMSPCARSLVLLGDPQQLPQVTQGIHPGGAGVSVLEHLLHGEVTVPADRGVFLEQTWRMHPDVCAFISHLAYDGRLRSEPDCARQAIRSAGLCGTGLRYLPVAHRGNSQQSIEEAAIIREEVQRLLAAGTCTDRNGVERALTPADILVVAPYNTHVRCLLHALPAGVEVGTVDKFQGREAPIVFFSMASSSGEEIPRGLDFLFSRNRLNVAISRAQALAVLVCSPRLLETRCRTVEQMRLVNGLCAFVEGVGPAAHPATRLPDHGWNIKGAR
jgi:predicted RecB family nuclease